MTVSAPASLQELFLRLLAATAAGGLIGLNRRLHHKDAGLRTLALVGLGAALPTIVALEVSGDTGAALSRLMQGILTGIGFVGAGVILHRADRNAVRGLTTAASIWVVAGLGIAFGAGLPELGGTALLIGFLVLLVGGRIENLLGVGSKPGGEARDTEDSAP